MHVLSVSYTYNSTVISRVVWSERNGVRGGPRHRVWHPLLSIDHDGVFGSYSSGERRLLQAKTHCPVNFEFQNYTIITSKCKGPEYSTELCCSSFKDFACPFVDYLNDLRNDCATVMFSYINLNGKYPAGLFASICREGKEGLECPALPPSSELSEKAKKNGSIRELFPMMTLVVASLVLTLQHI